MPYELWDLETGNYMETLDNEEEVQSAIDEYADANGDGYRHLIGVRPALSDDEWQPVCHVEGCTEAAVTTLAGCDGHMAVCDQHEDDLFLTDPLCCTI